MKQIEKSELYGETQRKHRMLRFAMGCLGTITDWKKAIVVAGYIVVVLSIWHFRAHIYPLQGSDLLTVLCRNVLKSTFPLYAGIGLFFLLVFLGTPWNGRSVRNNLLRVGLVNYAGEAPLLLKKYADKKNQRVTVLEFQVYGISRSEWEDKQMQIEAALNVYVVKVTEGKNKHRILLYTVPVQNTLSQSLHWNNDYLNDKNFVLVLGESLLGPVTVNLVQIPHILLGGSTGSGKSVLLKLLLMQCIKKNAMVYIADFKGGVDFSNIWHRKCKFITEQTELFGVLADIVDELELRKKLLASNECANIDQYNEKMKGALSRIVFACDEVAEVLDKTGLPKDGKELVSKIESAFSTIARQGRAFGIHLILATQRPDANILPGQIKNNINCRVCGRADNILSQIILDNTDAADQIPKDAQGRFLMNDGTVFQGYLINESRGFD